MRKLVIAVLVLMLGLVLGCSKIEEAAEETRKKGNEAVDRVLMEPQRKAEEAKEQMNKAIQELERNVERVSEETSESIKENIQ